MARTNWYDETLCKIHFDMHTPGTIQDVGSRFDPREFASAVKSSGAEAVCFFARCAYGWSYYPTEIGFPHPNLSRDLFGDGLKAMKDKGIRVIAYMAMCSIPELRANPRWVAKLPDGTDAAGHIPGTVPACTSTYPREHLIPQMLEVAARYDVDGFFLDGVYHYFQKACHCETCRNEFRDYTRKTGVVEIPTHNEDPSWPTWHAWQRERISALWGDASRRVADAKPGCLVGVNWLGDVRWSVPPPADIGYLTGDPPMVNCTFDSLYHGAAWCWRGKPFDIMNQRMLINWQDFTTRTPESIETDFAFEVAGGGRIFIGDLLTPEHPEPDPEVLSVIARGFRFANDRIEALNGFTQSSDIAILSSPESVRRGEQRWRVDESPVRGAFLATMEAGITADILFDADLSDNLQRYRTLVIPEQAFVQISTIEAIDGFVRNGGGLVVTGSVPGSIEPGGDESSASKTAFERLLGVESNGHRDEEGGYLRLRSTDAEGFWRESDESRPPVSVAGRAADCSPRGARTLAPLTVPGPLYQIGARPPAETTDSIGISEHIYGKGKVIFCALPLASDFWNRGNPGAKYVLQGMIRNATKSFSVRREGPTSVTVRKACKANRTAVHLATFQPDHRPTGVKSVESPAEIHGVRVYLRDDRSPKTIKAVPGGVDVPWTQTTGTIDIQAPPFSIHTALLIEW